MTRPNRDQPSDRILAAWTELSARSTPSITQLSGPTVRVRPRPAQTSSVGAAVLIVMGVVVALGYLALPPRGDRTGPTLPVGASSRAPSGSASMLVIGITPLPASSATPSTTPSSSSSSPLVSPTHGLDADGVPTTIGGRPVLRGDAIRRRALGGGAGPFLAAGWVNYRAGGPCPSSSSECEHIELVDRPAGDGATPAIELLSKDGQDWPSWAPRYFSILEVRTSGACARSERVCLAVDTGISGPPEPTPVPPPTPANATYDDAGIPITVDGEPVFRDFGIRRQAVRGGVSFLVTGRIQVTIYDCLEGACPLSAVRVLVPPAPIAPPAPGLVPDYVLLDDSESGTWGPYDPRRWPNDLVVLRVRAYDLSCRWQRFCDGALFVEAQIPPPATTPPSPSP